MRSCRTCAVATTRSPSTLVSMIVSGPRSPTSRSAHSRDHHARTLQTLPMIDQRNRAPIGGRVLGASSCGGQRGLTPARWNGFALNYSTISVKCSYEQSGVDVAGTMRVSVLRAAGEVAVDERPVPTPGDGEVLVRIGAVGVCGSNVHYYDHGRIGPYVVDHPLVLGHEAGGVVEHVGSGVTSLVEGQRVSVEPGVPCRNCTQCLAGRYNLCPEVKFFATPPYDGAFAGFVVMPAGFVFPVPDTVSDDAAGLIEPLSVGVWACRRTQVEPGSRVLVTGAGPIGLIAAQTAR